MTLNQTRYGAAEYLLTLCFDIILTCSLNIQVF